MLEATLAAAVRSRADDANVGLEFEGDRWSWAEVVAEMEHRAHWLRSLTWTGPRHVGVLLDNVPEFLFLYGAAALSGAVVVGLNPTRRGEELARDVRHTDCGIVVTDATYADLLSDPELDLDLGGARILRCDEPGYAGQIAEAEAGPLPLVSAEDLLLLLFTSGSTGAPKAVRFTQSRAAAAATQMWFTPDDGLYCAMPMFHGNALVSMVFPAIGTGARLVLRRRFSASSHMREVREHDCTFFSTVGRALSYLLETPEHPDDKRHRLQVVLAPESSVADAQAFQERFGCPAIGGYGSSENAVILVPFPGLPPDALGVPLEGLDVAVVHPDGRECAIAAFDEAGNLTNAQDAVGEIVGRNALDRFEGYYNNPEADQARSRNGWYWTGDLGYRSADNVFYFAGRTANWIRVDSENFAAAPIERLLARSARISDAVVFGVPDERTADDQVMAVVETSEDFDPVEFDAFLAAQPDLGTKWSPRYVRVLGRLPVMATNKVDRARLRREGWDVDGTIFWRPHSGETLQPMTERDRAALREQFDQHGRRPTR